MKRSEIDKSIIGTVINGKVDRQIGSKHPKYPDMIYSVNYGYTDDFTGGDREPQDVYVLGTNVSIEEFSGKIIAIYHRVDDVEDKWIVSVDEKEYSDEEILSLIEFQEKYFRGELVR